MLIPASRSPNRVFTGVLVPRKTQAPLTLPGMLSTAGHCDQSRDFTLAWMGGRLGLPGEKRAKKRDCGLGVPGKIEDYAIIGDRGTAALVGRDGSIDWLCLPRFDSQACFAALLGGPENGRWLLGPKTAPLAVRRKYREGTLILETEFETRDGVVAVIDCMQRRDGVIDVMRLIEGR